MKKIYTTLVIALFSMYVFGQVPNWAWAKSAGGSSDEVATGIAVDAAGNSYVTGYFKSSSITFGSTTLTNSSPGFNDIFIVKYDVSGNIIWAKSAGTNGDDRGNSIAVDAGGNSYVTGYYAGTITFGSTTLTPAGNADMYIVKYDVSGNAVWASAAAGSGYDSGNSIAVDASGNSYVTGCFASSSLAFGSTTLTNAGGGDIFIVKYDVSGNAVWARSAGGSYDDEGDGIAVDVAGNSYVTGSFINSPITFGGIALTPPLGVHMFIVKYDASGNAIWAKYAGVSSNGSGIALDSGGNSYVTGYFGLPITFGSTTLTSAGGFDMFIVKYDLGCNVVWAKAAGGSADDRGNSIAVDAGGNNYVTGYFSSSSITFGSDTLTNTGSADIFMVKSDTSGNAIWTKSAGGISSDRGNSIAVGAGGNCYVTGYFNSSSITFGSDTLTSAGGFDMFIAKLGSGSEGITESEQNNAITISPNPFTSKTCITFQEEQKNTTIKITDLLGKEIKTINFTGRQLVIDKAEMKAGIYFVQTTDEKKNITNKKIIIQ